MVEVTVPVGVGAAFLPSFLFRPLTPAALLHTVYEVVSKGRLIVVSTTAASFVKDGRYLNTPFKQNNS